jgi:hypothetical protein
MPTGMATPAPASGDRPEKLKMNGIDQRKWARVETCNLISYTCLDEMGLALKQGMGRALDVSQDGLLLECGAAIESDVISLLSADAEDRLIEIRGEVVHSRRNENGNYRVGIRFQRRSNEEKIRFATSLIKSFHYKR